MSRFSNADQPCRDCGQMVRWVTSPKNLRILLDADAAEDGVYALDYRPGETKARWVHSPFRERLRASEGLYREHSCSAFVKRSA